jgi:hypothetical protein
MSVVLAVDMSVSVSTVWLLSLPSYGLVWFDSEVRLNLSWQWLMGRETVRFDGQGPAFWRYLMSPSSLEGGDQTTRCHLPA